MNGNRSYDPHSKSLPGVPARKRPPLSIVVSNDPPKDKSE